MTNLEAFYVALKIDPKQPAGCEVHEIEVKLGHITLIQFPLSLAVKDPSKPLEENVPHGEHHNWRSVKCSGPTVMFLNGEFQSFNLMAGYQMVINVTERNLLDAIEVACRTLKDPPENISNLLKTLDQIRDRNLHTNYPTE